jgi:signal transduction histidine kinase
VAEVSVADTGVGIAPADQEAVFEEFRQVGAAERKAEGTGPGRGSTFTFTLPVRSGLASQA